jgi:endoglucanase
VGIVQRLKRKLRQRAMPRRRLLVRGSAARLPWDVILILMGCLVLILQLTGNFPTLAAIARPTSISTTTALQPPFSTRGAAIVDSQGQTVILRGVNWFGIETKNNAPHGLWARDYKAMLAEIKGLGYNLIRLPYSVQAMRATQVSGIDYSQPNNRTLQGKTPIEVMDAIVTEAGKQGLFILLDSHRLGSERIPDLWYGDGYTEGDWIRTWAMLAERYKNQPQVIGADLKNEPHGIASWGTGDRRTDWRLAAERAGNAILNINPDWLIVVEGVEWNVPGQQLAKHWIGGNLEGVRRFPVRLNRPHKVVYSPHEYGPGVFKQKWFQSPSFPENLRDRWEKGFFYIVRENIAPILIGEFGGKKVDGDSQEGQWQNLLVDFIGQNQLSYAYWSWNPNSRDTGGILQDDWKTVQPAKQAMLNRTLPAIGMVPVSDRPILTTGQYQPAPSVIPSSSPVPSPSTSPLPAQGKLSQLTLRTTVQSQWETGFCLAIAVTNPGPTPVSQWQLEFELPNATIDQSWNATFQAKDNRYSGIPADWGTTVQPQQVINLGFCIKKQGPTTLPEKLRFQIVPRG